MAHIRGGARALQHVREGPQSGLSSALREWLQGRAEELMEELQALLARAGAEGGRWSLVQVS